MANKNYVKGRKKEYKIVKELREKGFDIVQRTAGSHSPIDIIAVRRRDKVIVFVQSKSDDYPESKVKKIKEELDYLNNVYSCHVIVK